MCQLLHLNRSGLYYKQKSSDNVSDTRLANDILAVYEEYPFYGYRKIHATLIRNGHAVNRKKVQRLMQCIGLRAVQPQKCTSIRNKSHPIYPYLLHDIEIMRPNQVWQVDLTYIKIRGGFVYLICLIDIFSRRIMGWHLSVFLDTTACLGALQHALQYANPEIINSDQGSQFTSESWCAALNLNNITISMDGKGRWADNIYIERLWRTIKYELVYLHRFESVGDVRRALEKYVVFYNSRRPHQSLQYRVPDDAYNGAYYVKQLDTKTEIVHPLVGAINHSQIFTPILS
jgi:putative transposase